MATIYGTPGNDDFVFNNVIGNPLYFPTASDSYIEVYVYSTDGFDIIKNYHLQEDRIISIDPQLQTSTHIEIYVSKNSPNENSPDSDITKYTFGTTDSDIILGTSANDIVYVFSGNDVVFGQGSNDRLYGGEGNDKLYGGLGRDILDGGLGNDYLHGGDGTNQLYGDAGDDILDGSGFFSDLLIGGTGNDIYIVDEFAVIIEGIVGDRIVEGFNQGTDTVQSPVSHKLGNNLENLLLTGSKNINGLGNDLDNRIEGNVGQNFLVGGNGNDHLHGYGNQDILAGEAGNDTLEGGTDNDFLEGGSGNDVLNGGFGKDILAGGAGADLFVFKFLFDGNDTIKDFNPKENDKIQISKTGFGTTSTNQFSYSNLTGALFFQGIQFATLENKPNFIPDFHIDLV
ncbi:calcium-binding protein [Scytonema sp. UIC 10036]|uniref:calcium-binding protein n=1 Tax=Scytonema sp. UIC 10036 TaxID=2304196 RepID=UPI00140FE1A6